MYDAEHDEVVEMTVIIKIKTTRKLSDQSNLAIHDIIKKKLEDLRRQYDYPDLASLPTDGAIKRLRDLLSEEEDQGRNGR